jgi:two-component system sensor kinase FixL
VRIVFANLTRNAREAMPEGGALTVEGRQAGDRVEVAVRDSGVGIAPDLLAKVTEPLYSTKARGLGLGLAIARSILEKNDGGLRVASEVGHGSTFTVVLRAAPRGGTP